MSAAASHATSTRPVGIGRWVLNGCLSDATDVMRVPISHSPFTVGRQSRNDLCLPSLKVSGFHAELIVTPQGLVLKDCGSTNGTFVNGERVRGSIAVREYDLVQFADQEFWVGREQPQRAEHTICFQNVETGWLFSRMAEVLNKSQFRMVFQPIVAGPELRPIGYEALVRSQVAGLETPGQLFAAAGRLGLSGQLSEQCRIKAVRTMFGEAPDQALFLNSHPDECLDEEVVQSLRDLRTIAGERPLVLEIHEDAVPNLALLRELGAALRDFAIELAYDDFGAGHSRLLELAQVPPRYLKFDRQLIAGLGEPSATQLALVRTLHQHASDLGIIPIAEGVETRAEYHACRDIGFTHFQGYLFGRPAPPDELFR